MKKKTRRFDEGGSVEQRAKFFAALADKPEEQEAFQRRIHEQQQAEAEASDRRRAGTTSVASSSSSSSPPAPKAAASSSSSPAPARSKYVGSTNDTGDEGAPVSGKFTDSDVESRAVRRSEAEDKNVRNIQRARDDDENVSNIQRARDEGAPRSRSSSSTNDAAPRSRSSSSTNDAAEAQNVRDVISAANRRGRENRAAISAENAERGGMSPQAERAVEAAGTAASVIPVVRGARAATEVGKRVAQGAEQAARVRQGLGRQFAEGAGDAARNTAVRATPRDVASSAREIARESIANRRAQSEARRLREAAERKARDDAKITERAMREESRQFGANLPPSIGERVSSAASNISDRARRLYNRAKGEPTLVRGRRADGSRRGFGESADDAAQAGYKKGGKVSASSRGDGIAQRGKTKGRLL